MDFDPVLVHGWLERSSHRWPGKTALVSDSRRLTYPEIDDLSTRLAQGLASAGVKRGDRVVVFLESSAEAVIAIYGILKAGGIFVIAEATATASTLRHILEDSQSPWLITHVEKAQIVKDTGGGGGSNRSFVWVGPSDRMPPNAGQVLLWDRVLEHREGTAKLPRIVDIDLAALIYTSGSTGKPKGIMCTHHNIVSAARSIIQYVGNDANDVILNALPLAFDYGLYQIIMCFMFGGTVVLERSVGFLEPLIQTIERESITGFPLVPSLSAMLLRLKRLPVERFKSLRYVTSTGALWPEAHIRKFRELLPHVKFFSMYGLTECKRVGFLPPELIDEYPGSVGGAMPNCEVTVVDGSGQAILPGETGELIVRGSNVMQGYWNDPETTKKVFKGGRYPADRLLHTGDWFRLEDDGLLYFVGRRDDLIKASGRRVSPREVEDVVASLAGIAEVAVIGVPDEINGQVIAVFAVARKEKNIDELGIKAFCEKHLELYKVPRYVWFVDSLPKTSNGKTDKKRLNEMAAVNRKGDRLF